MDYNSLKKDIKAYSKIAAGAAICHVPVLPELLFVKYSEESRRDKILSLIPTAGMRMLFMGVGAVTSDMTTGIIANEFYAASESACYVIDSLRNYKIERKNGNGHREPL